MFLITTGPLLLLLTSCLVGGSSSGILPCCQPRWYHVLGISQCRRSMRLMRIHILLFFFLAYVYRVWSFSLPRQLHTCESDFFDARLLENELVQSLLRRLLTCLASKRKGKQQNCLVLALHKGAFKNSETKCLYARLQVQGRNKNN